MKNRFASFIMSIVVFLIISVFGLFGIILWNEWVNLETDIKPENVKTLISETQDTLDEEVSTPQILENPLEKIKDNENANAQIEQNSQKNDKYFYNQLEEESKIIYTIFENNKENMKTGTYRIELGNSFSSLLQQADGQEQLGKYYQSAIEAYTYDNPEVFYLSPNKMYLNIETTTKGKNVTHYVYINSGNESNYLIDEFSSKEQINQALEEIEQIKNQIVQNRKTSTYDNIKMVHDYLVENIEYDTSLTGNHIYNIYGAMVSGKAVCEGYARSFKYLMDALEIPCTLVIGKGTNSEGQTENHAWNYVQIDGVWYAIDVTWDDPVSNTGWVSQSNKYRYFLKGSKDILKDHIPTNTFTEGGKYFNYPDLNSENYN